MNGLVKCFVLIVMLGVIPMSYASSNTNTLLPEIKALALDKLVLDRKDKPVTVLETPVITDASGKVAQGLTKVKVSLASDAVTSLIILGKSLKPGQSMTIVQDLTATGGVLKIPFYPETSNIAGISHYSLDIPNITAEICPDSYSLNSATNSCQKVNTTSLLYTCPGDNWTYSGDVSKCIKQTEIPKTTCPVGFDSNGDGTCTKTEYEATVAKCSAGFAYSETNERCEKTLVAIADKICSDPSYTYEVATNDCRKTITQSVNYDCFLGFSYNSTLKICERTLSTDATPICTTGYSYSTTNKRCEKTVAQTATKTCTSGFTYSVANNRCEKALTTTADPVCTSGYTYSAANSRCEQTLIQTASKVCASGYTYSSTNNRCEKTTTLSATPVCSNGYSYSSANSRCEKTVIQAASKVCTSGYIYSSTNNRCEKTLSQTASKVCTSGYTYSSTNNRCEKILTQTASKVCASGYTYSSANNRCEKTTTLSATPVCSSGYTYSSANARCEKTLTQTASKVCASGYTYSSINNRCEKTTTLSATPVCSSGYTYSSANARCEKTLTQTASKVCASGYTYSSANNLCEKTTTLPATPVCSSGTYNSATNTCSATVNVAATSQCPSGYSYVSALNTCNKVVTTTPYLSCPSGAAPDWDSDLYLWYCGDTWVTASSSQTCPVGAVTNTKLADGPTRPKVTCRVTQYASPSLACPSGYTISGANCTGQTSSPVSSYSCPSGYSLSGSTCSLLQAQAFSYSCPSGYSLSGSTCSRLQTGSNTLSCPSGYSLSGSTCSLLQVQAFSYSCPSGYSLSGSTCSRLQTASNTLSCPSGYSLSGSTCSLFQMQAFSYSCPSGYSLSGSTCSLLQAQAFSYSCPSGYSLSGSTCSLLQVQAFSYNCPSGYTLSGSTCSQLQNTNNTWSCPGGYTLSGSACSLLQAQAFNYSCPSGYSLSVSTCSKLINTSNSWSCDSGWTLSGSTCHSTDALEFSYTCPIDYVNHNDGSCTQLQNTANTWNCPTNYANSNDGSCSWYQTALNSLSCSDPTYTAYSNDETCKKVLTDTYIYNCTDSSYSLSGSSCSLLLTEQEEWICDDNSFGKISETQCKKETDANLAGSCPIGFVASPDGKSCEYSDTTPLINSCSASFTLKGGECVKDVYFAPICSTSFVDSSCSCDSGMTLNPTTYQCEGIEKKAILVRCPVGYYAQNGQCEYHKTVDVVYDFCPLGMMAQNGVCVLTEEISTTLTCNAPYTLQGSECKYIDTKPTGYVLGVDSVSYDGGINTEISAITLGTKKFDAIVSEISEIAVDDITGCRLVTSEELAKGEIKKGDIPCFVKWTALPEGITGINDKVSGIFQQSGTQSLEYSLFGFNGNAITEFEISKGKIDLTVNEPPKPAIDDVTTRLMSQVSSGFEMYNYSEDSQLSYTTVLVKPRTYIQKVTIDDIGTCYVSVGASSCTIYSSVAFTKDLAHLQFDSNYKIIANSKIGGWDEANLITEDWVIHHDFRGPNIAFTSFNPILANDPVVNSDLGFTVAIAGGQGAVGVSNFRSELVNTDTWWKPSRVELVFTAKEGTQSVSTIMVDGNEITFDIPNSTADSKKITNISVISESFASAYPFEMTSLTPGEYNVQVIAKDTYNNETIETYNNVVVARPIPQIKVMHKGRAIEQLSSAQTVNMLDDLTIVAHNGVVGESKITSIKIDGREVITTNNDTYFKKLTGEGFDLEANSSYVLEVEAEDKEGHVASLSLPFNYLQMTFGINHKPVTVIQKVEDVALTVNRTRGIRCDLYGTKAAAALASNDNNYACYIEWSTLPAGLTPSVATYQSKLSGAVTELGMNTVTYNAYIVNKSGRAAKVGSETVTFEAIEPLPLEIALDDKLKLSEGVYSVSINDTLLGRYRGQSSRAHVDVRLSNEFGDEKLYKHNQLPFGETQTFSAYAERLGDAVLWDKTQYTLKANYRLAPELTAEQKFDLIVTPHPYMQVLMDLDSPQYTSIDTINATISLGLRNNMTGLFEYDQTTMGTGWDVYLAFKKGNTFEPITESTSIDSTGKGLITLDANIIFERNLAIYAIAKAQSPYPDIAIERVSIPRSITVVKGSAVDGKVVSRLVQSRVPANFDIRFDTDSYDDFRVLGDIEWQKQDSLGNWLAEPSFDNKQYISIKSTSPETIKIRALVTNKETLVQTHSDEVTLISYDVPTLKIDGASQAISGQDVLLSALDNGETPPSDAIVEWSLDNGETWEAGGLTYDMVVGESALKIKGRMKYANTSVDIKAGQWSEATKYISVTKPKALIVNVVKPNLVEVGTEIELSLQVANQFAATGVPVLSEWIMPDGSTISNESTIKYLVKEEDLDNSNRLNLKARAWLEGYKDVTLGESNVVMNSFSYSFPTDDQLSLSINNNVKFVPSTGFAVLNIPYINAPGVKFSYDWMFDQEAIEKTSGFGKSMNFRVLKAGVHKITLAFSDNRGNFTYIDGFVDAIEPEPLEFKVTEVFSNRYMRSPLTISLYPSVKTSHPYDFMKEFVWTINGDTGEPSSRAIGVFDDLEPGHYDVELNVTSNFGQQGKHVMSFDVKQNQAPVCEPVVREQYGTHIVDANCKDSDGTISYYRWVVNGTIFSPYGAQVRFSENDFPSATIVIEAVDDAGAKGIGNASF
ncbi:Ig-like domain-containing protein [Shewanella frigidimarina]|uniref:Ig-like domain-containing protein n=1 Tax=Shewanella frigidimarina TaxID=56812 RepID=UPI003D7BB6DB